MCYQALRLPRFKNNSIQTSPAADNFRLTAGGKANRRISQAFQQSRLTNVLPMSLRVSSTLSVAAKY